MADYNKLKKLMKRSVTAGGDNLPDMSEVTTDMDKVDTKEYQDAAAEDERKQIEEYKNGTWKPRKSK